MVDATRAALDYLESLHAHFDGDWLLAVAAYNTGEGNVRRAMRRNRARGKPVDFWSLRLPRETRAYVPRLLAVAEIVARPDYHGVELLPIPDRAAFDVVELDGQIDLAVAAELADISIEDLYLLNPGFNRWATDPNGPHRLLIPAGEAEAFQHALSELPPERRITWQRHQIETGDTLGTIAQRYATSIKALKQANGLRGTRIRAGHSLIVPVASRSLEDYTLSAEVRRVMRRVQPGEGRKRTHVVRSGDSLWLISRRYGVTISRLAAWNGISRKAILRPGQRLVVWQHQPSSGRSARKGKDTGPVTGSTGVYVVRRGDSLWTIAKRHRVTVTSLARWNNLNKRTALQPGQQLRVAASSSPAHAMPVASLQEPDSATRPIAYTVRPGDTLWEIARDHQVGVGELRKWNGLRAKDHLQPGQQLTVMVPLANEI